MVIGINGLGRIGRCVLKQLLDDERFTVGGVNDLAEPADLAYLLRYDSVYGVWGREVRAGEGALLVGGEEIPFSDARDPGDIPWREWGAEVVLECTGAFRGRDDAARHLEAGAERVIISAPSEDADGTFLPGINLDQYDRDQHRVVSLASCTTNSLAPVAQVLDQAFGVEYLFLTTVHAYTSSQALVDKPARKRRRGRAAAESIVPTTTGAAQATERVLPRLAGRMDGMAIRVPVPAGSISDVVATLRREATAEGVNEALRQAAGEPPLRGILRVSDEELVSRDIVGDPCSSIVDALSTRVLGNRMVKVLAWYDNEWGYAARLLDCAAHVA
ncbi:MAG TPA: type I glyceraldehyde-3-phosphate dehydrogenase [Thermoanaerobaculia bacterium]|nr:type I glyceraldehyde-3-phosphate dehydrogenase [Thermoanaerobaculia bacterium]